MRTLMSLVVVVLVTPAPLGAMQAPPAQVKPAAAQAPAAKPATPPAQAKPNTPAPAPAKPAAAPAPAPAKPAAPAAQAKPNAPQAPSSAPVEAQTPPPPPPPPAAASASETYTYDPSGRRDPFENLMNRRGTDKFPTPRHPEGVAGLSVNEISVRGVIESRGGYVAMVQGPDNKTYAIHTGDKMFDGLVRAVNAEGLIIVQEVNDPLSLVKTREVSKKLRSLEAKE